MHYFTHVDCRGYEFIVWLFWAKHAGWQFEVTDRLSGAMSPDMVKAAGEVYDLISPNPVARIYGFDSFPTLREAKDFISKAFKKAQGKRGSAIKWDGDWYRR